MVEAIIALGSNVGDRENNLRQAILGINEERETRVVRVSSVYETEPMYFEHQARFLNCVLAAETHLRPTGLLDCLQELERKLGRRPGPKNGPRVIDLDILFYGNEVVTKPNLEIPHPRITERPFVLVPLNEIRPDLIHPVLGMKVSELLANVGTGEGVVKKPGMLANLGL
jgi:2-amino-4-hydroxy-6-hydroxymethyldihydropteridine diphosphokinase